MSRLEDRARNGGGVCPKQLCKHRPRPDGGKLVLVADEDEASAGGGGRKQGEAGGEVEHGRLIDDADGAGELVARAASARRREPTPSRDAMSRFAHGKIQPQASTKTQQRTTADRYRLGKK